MCKLWLCDQRDTLFTAPIGTPVVAKSRSEKGTPAYAGVKVASITEAYALPAYYYPVSFVEMMNALDPTLPTPMRSACWDMASSLQFLYV